jgi:hypothetical protein
MAASGRDIMSYQRGCINVRVILEQAERVATFR